uniref:Uncharacterized protein n=1 Tax=Cacopsylla melanoneura TaxID=428564 RepID=A0A8D8PTY1_9HEMI
MMVLLDMMALVDPKAAMNDPSLRMSHLEPVETLNSHLAAPSPNPCSTRSALIPNLTFSHLPHLHLNLLQRPLSSLVSSQNLRPDLHTNHFMKVFLTVHLQTTTIYQQPITIYHQTTTTRPHFILKGPPPTINPTPILKKTSLT